MTAAPIKPGLGQPVDTSPDWFDGLPERLQQAALVYDIANTGDFEPLADLSAATLFEGIEVFGDSAVKLDDGSFAAPASVYVTLVYDPNGEQVEMNDAYPARVLFSIDDDRQITVSKIDVDTSSFYE